MLINGCVFFAWLYNIIDSWLCPQLAALVAGRCQWQLLTLTRLLLPTDCFLLVASRFFLSVSLFLHSFLSSSSHFLCHIQTCTQNEDWRTDMTLMLPGRI